MPRLSIVVPTRERSDTLFHTIRTLVTQDYEDCEFLISDNASQDRTREVALSFSDPRIRYINTSRRLSMSDNWEFAMGEVRGDFVTYIGDDDGFIPGGVTKAMRVIENSRMDALVWERVTYNWPDFTYGGLANWLSLRTGDSQVYVTESKKRLTRLLLFRDGYAYTRLPGVYHSMVRKTLIDTLKSSSAAGIFFDSIAPDVFSAIALACVIPRYMLSEYPFTVMGCSRHSTGASFSIGKASDPDSSVTKFISEVSREYDLRIKLAPAVETAVMGEYLQVRQCWAKLSLPEPSWDRYVRGLIRRSIASPGENEILASASHTIAQLGLKIGMPDRAATGRPTPPSTGMAGDILKFKAPVELVSNIYDACRLIEGMLPAPGEGDARTALTRFIRNMNRCFVSEAKTLYRSL